MFSRSFCAVSCILPVCSHCVSWTTLQSVTDALSSDSAVQCSVLPVCSRIVSFDKQTKQCGGTPRTNSARRMANICQLGSFPSLHIKFSNWGSVQYNTCLLVWFSVALDNLKNSLLNLIYISSHKLSRPTPPHQVADSQWMTRNYQSLWQNHRKKEKWNDTKRNLGYSPTFQTSRDWDDNIKIMSGSSR